MSKLVGILNITPDSFSDGNPYATTQDFVRQALEMAACGADVIDIGAESTRPGATTLSVTEEWSRLYPIVDALMGALPEGIEVSIDTRHATTAKQSIDLGAHWINDVSGFADPAMVDAVADSTCRLVVMHSLTVPADPKVTLPEEADVVEAVAHFLQARCEQLIKKGIDRNRIILDPGIGFGKTAEQSWALLRCLDVFERLGYPLFVGHSRKSFLKPVLKHDLHSVAVAANNVSDSATLAVSGRLMQQRISYLRVHNVPLHVELRNVIQRLQGG